MIMPFLRLVVIYIVVILGAMLVFKRDSVMPLLGLPWGGSDAEIATVSDAADTPAKPADPAIETTAPPAATPLAEVANDTGAKAANATEVAAPSKYPTAETAQPAAPTPPTPTTSATEIQSRLEAARSAYWKRDLKTAEALYKALIADAPTNADIKGELGNLYYGQRRMKDAARLYHQTGLQLIADGNRRQIMPLIGVLQSIAPDKANELRNRLSQ